MKWLNCIKIRLMLIGFVAAIVFGGGERAKADFTFGTPILVPNVNSSSAEASQSISFDGLTLYFASNRPGGYGNADIWVSTRPTTEDEWGEPQNLGPPVNSSSDDYNPSISADGLTLYFSDYFYYPRPGGFGGCDIWKTTRVTTEDDWGEPVNLGSPINSSTHDLYQCISLDGLSLYFTSYRPGGYGKGDLWISKRESASDTWREPMNLGPTVNTSNWDGKAAISADGCILFFTSNRSGGAGSWDLWMTKRATIHDHWTTPVPLPINTGYDDGNAGLSADGRTLYFFSTRPGGPSNGDLWQSPIVPIVDFNCDVIVDIDDLMIMIEHWGTNESLCDIGPMAWGDGVVNEEDLEVLMSYWGQEFDDPTLTTHWKLDEAEGIIAEDSAGGNDGIVNGDPLWQPEGGMVDGAIELDGINDYISTPFILNPVVGEFSVFAWIKGGAPGQTIISQANGVNWLLADTSEGKLASELISGRGVAPLVSNVVITDGEWHRVGLTWDKSRKVLYVDDVEVASDTLGGEGNTGGLYIGAGKKLETGKFWSGLIDDVRIYNRVVIP